MVFAVHAFPSFGVGRFGVDLFFVLSGYLITGLLTKELYRTGSIDLGGFYLRRFARIVPAYAVLLGFLAPVLSLRHLAGFSPFAGNLAMIGSSPPLAAAHLWSVCVEMQFYLAWPVLVARCRVLPLAVLMFVGPLATRLLIYALDLPHDAVWFFTPTRLDAFAVGALLSLRPVALSRWCLVPVAVALLKAEWLLGTNLWPFAYTLSAIACGAILCAAQTLPVHPVIPRIGVVTYGAYLFHLPLIELTGPVAAFGLTLALAAVSWRLLETPTYELLSATQPKLRSADSEVRAKPMLASLTPVTLA